GLVEAAEGAALALRRALTDILSEGEAREAEREQFYTQTEAAFLTSVMQLRNGQAIEDVGRDWLATLSHQVKAQFHTHALPGLETADIHKIARIVAAQRGLFATMAGYTKLGRDIFSALLREPPKKATKRNAA
ncbi:MAG: hypothetical protein ACPG7W_07385, partial [Paracoccaceae bacterium]